MTPEEINERAAKLYVKMLNHFDPPGAPRSPKRYREAKEIATRRVLTVYPNCDFPWVLARALELL